MAQSLHTKISLLAIGSAALPVKTAMGSLL